MNNPKLEVENIIKIKQEYIEFESTNNEIKIFDMPSRDSWAREIFVSLERAKQIHKELTVLFKELCKLGIK